MNKIITTALLLFIFLLLLSDRISAQDNETGNDRPTIALVNRVVEIVEHRTPEVDWKNANIGDLLNSGDVLRTGPASFSLVRFYDNSLLRIRELSEVTVYADRDRENYHRNINVDEGSVSFDIRKKETDRFEFSTPTSVASIRGSTGIFAVSPEGVDALMMITGYAVLLNLITGEEVELMGGWIGFSSEDGTLEIREITREDIDKYGELDLQKERQQRTIEIQFIDEDGTLQTVIIEFDEDKNDH